MQARRQLIEIGELNAYDVLCNDWIVFTTGTLAAGTYQFRAFIDDPANLDSHGRQRVSLRTLTDAARRSVDGTSSPPRWPDGGTDVPHSGTPGIIA